MPAAAPARARPADHGDPAGAVRREAFQGQYRELVVGQRGLWPLVRYELVMLLASWVPGALGLFLRSKLYPLILGGVGRNVVFGVNVMVRHPHKIVIGDNVVIDDQCCLDAKGTDNRGILIGNGVFVGRNTILSCKNGDIVIEDHANLGFNCEIFSASRVRVGKSILMAAYTYWSAAITCTTGSTFGAAAGPDRARHRRRRRHVARRARGRHGRIDRRPRRHHWRRRRRRRSDSGLRHRDGDPSEGTARSSGVGSDRARSAAGTGSRQPT